MSFAKSLLIPVLAEVQTVKAAALQTALELELHSYITNAVFPSVNSQVANDFNAAGAEIVGEKAKDGVVNIETEATVLNELGWVLVGAQVQPIEATVIATVSPDGLVTLDYTAVMWSRPLLDEREATANTRSAGEMSGPWNVLINGQVLPMTFPERTTQYYYWRMIEYGTLPNPAYMLARYYLADGSGKIEVTVPAEDSATFTGAELVPTDSDMIEPHYIIANAEMSANMMINAKRMELIAMATSKMRPMKV